jgi:hypothetical protein
VEEQCDKELKNLSLQEFIYSVGLNHASYYSLQRDGNLPRADEAIEMIELVFFTRVRITVRNC